MSLNKNLCTQVISSLIVLVVGGVLAAFWLPVSAEAVREETSAYVQYLPLIPAVDCIPGPLIQPDDLERDIAVEARINEIRAEHSLPHLTNSQKITQSALRHSNDMADNNFFDHTGSDGSNAGRRLDEACYKWQVYGEIIAAGYRSPASVVDAWMGSDGHRGVILDTELTEFGAGYAYNRKSELKHYWTVDFGLRASVSTSGASEFYTCKYHFAVDEGEIWLSLHSVEPCGSGFEGSPGLSERR